MKNSLSPQYFGNGFETIIFYIHRIYAARQIAITEKLTYKKGKAFY